MVSFSENNFTLNPQERRPFTAYFTFKPDTPIKDYNLSINIVAGAVNLPPNASPGKASFNLPVAIISTAVPEFPIPAAVLAAAVFLIAAFHGRRRRKRTVEESVQIRSVVERSTSLRGQRSLTLSPS